jgi:hypothetical protein
MNKLLLSILFSVSILQVFAASYVSTNTYTVTRSTATYGVITGTTAIGGGWNSNGSSFTGAVSSAIPLGFTFYMNGVGQTQCYIHGNGYITFGSAPLSSAIQPLNTNNGFNSSISAFAVNAPTNATYAAYWGLYDPAGTNPIIYTTQGTAPNRVFTVQWKNAQRLFAYGLAGFSESFNFQINLYEGTNNIVIWYGPCTVAYTSLYASVYGPNSPTVGIGGSATTDCIAMTSWTSNTTTTTNTTSISTNTTTGGPASGLQFTFTPKPTLAPNPSPVTIFSYLSTSRDTTISFLGNNLTSNVSITPSGSQFQISVNGGSTWITSGNTTTLTPTSGLIGPQSILTRFTAPASAGSSSGSILFASTGASSTTVTLTGTALNPVISATPTTLTFSNPAGMTSSSQSITLSAAGLTGAITVSSAGSTNFQIWNPNTSSWVTAGGSFTLSGTGYPGGTYGPSTIPTRFIAPVSLGSSSATVTFSSASATSQTVTLNGTSTAAPLNGTYNIINAGGGDFTSLAAAIDAANTRGISGPVTLNVVAGNAQTAPAAGASGSVSGAAGGGYVINIRGDYAPTATNTLTIAGNNNTITASSSLTAGGLSDAIFTIAGTSYVTIKNFNMVDNSTTTVTAGTNTKTELGVALVRDNVTGYGAQYCTISGNTITLGQGAAYVNTAGIYSNANNVFNTAYSTGASPSSSTGANSYNTYASNIISGVTSGILIIGNPNYNDANNMIGGGVSTGNTITLTVRTAGWGVTYSGYGSYISTQQGVFVSNNTGFTIDHNTASIASGSSLVLYGIMADVCVDGSYTNTITYNTINQASASTANVFGIRNNSGGSTSATGSTLACTNNTITQTAASTSPLFGIYNSRQVLNANFTYNNIQASTSSTGIIYNMYNDQNQTNLNIDYNTFGDPTLGSPTFGLNATSSASSCFAIINVPTTVTNLSISNNYINAKTTTATLYGVYNQATSGTVVASNNIIKLATTGGTTTGTGYGIYNYNATTTSATMSGNTITISGASPSSGGYNGFVGIYNTGTSPVLTCNNNTINIANSVNPTSQDFTYGIFNTQAVTAVEMAYNNVTINAKSHQVIAVGSGPGSGSNSVNLSNNTIDVSQTGTVNTNSWYIYNYPSATSPTGGTSTVNNNTFKSASGFTTTTGAIFFVSNNYCPPSSYVQNNVTSGTITKSGAGGSIFGFVSALGPTAYTVENISNNTLSNISFTGGSGTFNGIVSNSNVNMPRVISNNTFSNIRGASSIAAIVLDAIPTNTTVSGNTIRDMSSSGAIYGITASLNSSVGSQSTNVLGGTFTGNNIYNDTTTGSSANYGIQLYGATTAQFTVSNNNIYNLVGNSTGTDNVFGIWNGPATAATISGNQLYNYTSNAAGTHTITGILSQATSGSSITISANNIYSLSPTGTTGNASQVVGMNLNSGVGTYNVFNNFITSLTAANASNYNAVAGIYMPTAGGTWNLYYNTINFGSGSAITSAGTNFGVSGVMFPTTGLLTMYNNYIQLNATPKPATSIGTGGVAACVRRDNSTAGTVPSTNFMANYNIYGNNSGNNNFLFAQEAAAGSTIVNYYSTANDANFNNCNSLYKTNLATGGRESNTYTESLLGTPSAGICVPSGTTYAKNGGLAISSPSITTDYSGSARSSTPDIGAKNNSGTSPASNPPVISFTTPIANSYCQGTTTNLYASVSSANTITTAYMYYKSSTDATTTIATANDNTVGGWKYVVGTNTGGSNWTFNVDYSKLSASLLSNPTISYFVVAQDNTGLYGIYPQVYNCAPTSLPITGGAAGPSGSPATPSSYTVTTPGSFTTTIAPQVLCGTGNPVLLSVTAPLDLNLQWQQDLGSSGSSWSNISGATTNNYSATPPAPPSISAPSATNIYRGSLTCNAFTGAVQTYTSSQVSSTDYSPSITSTTPGSRCGTGSVSLSATGIGGVENWYTAATGGLPIGTTTSGGIFTTPTITASTSPVTVTYYVSDSSGAYGTGASGVQTIGPASPSAVGANASTSITPGYNVRGINFTVSSVPLVIQSVDIYPASSSGGTFTIAVYDNSSSTIYASYSGSSSVTSGGTTPQTVPVNFVLPPGNYQMAFSNIAGGNNMYCNSAGGSFPYAVQNNTYATITLNSGTSTGSYNAFYNWKVKAGCTSSPRVAVVATVNPLPTASSVTASPSSPCAGSAITLHESAPGSGPAGAVITSYQWSGPNGYNTSASASSVADAVFTPTTALASGYYSLTVTYSGTGCTSPAAQTGYVTVTPNVTPTLTGTFNGCVGTANSSISASPSGGAWSVVAGTGTATIDASSGVITGVTEGTVTISYTSLCGTSASATYVVNTTPGAISGASTICFSTGFPLTYTNPVSAPAGGSAAWASSNTFTMSIDASTGVATSGGSLGSTNVSYTITTAGGGSCVVTLPVTVTNTGTLPAITGSSSVCIGQSVTLSNATAGGTWGIQSGTGLATVGSSTGVVTGISAGSPVISYTTGCATVSYTVTVNGASVTLSNNGPICSGSPLTLTATVSGSLASSSWSGPNSFSASSNLTPLVSASATTAASGNYSFTFTPTGGCSSQTYYMAVVVDPVPTATPTVTPTSGAICVGGSTTLNVAASSATRLCYAIPYSPVSFTASGTYSNSSGTWTGGTNDGAFALSLPFSFNFFGTNYNSVNVSANGYVNFGTMISSGYSTATTLPSSAAGVPQNMIALFWHNMSLASSGSITYGTTGSIPYRKFIISYNAVPDAAGGNTNTGQIVFYETYNYVDLIVASASSAYAKVCGVQNSTGTTAVTAPGQNNTSYLVTSAGQAWRFGLPNYTDYTWTPTAGLSSSTSGSPAFSTGVVSTYNFSVTVRDVNISSYASCPSSAGTASVTVSSLPEVASATASESIMCSGGLLTLSAGSVSGGAGSLVSYTWSGLGGYSSTTASTSTAMLASASGAYSVIANYSAPGCTSAAPAVTAAVTVVAQPSVTTLTPSFASACAGTALTLSASSTGGTGTAQYTWSGPAITTTTGSSATSPVFTPTLAGSNAYLLTLHYSGAGCSDASLSTNVTTNAIPSISLGAVPSRCEGLTSVSVPYTSATGGPTTYSVDWSPAANAAGINDITNAALSGGVLSLAMPASGGIGSFDGTVTVSNGSCTSDPYNAHIISYATPVMSVTAVNTPCYNHPGSIEFTGADSATVNYTVDGGSVNHFTFSGTTYSLSTGVLTGTHVYDIVSASNPVCATTYHNTITVNPIVMAWVGGTTGHETDWNTAANWTCGFVPASSDSVVINNMTYPPVMPAAVSGTVSELNIAPGSTVDLGSGATLNVTGDINNAGAVTGTGRVVMNGSSAQKISGIGTISNLELNNSNGATIQPGARTMISSTLYLTAGTLTTNDSLELLSTDTFATARIAEIPATGAAVSGRVKTDQYVQGGYRRWRFWGHCFSDTISLSQLTPFIDITGPGGSTRGFTTTTTNAPSAYWHNTYGSSDDSTGYDPGWRAFNDIRLTAADSNWLHPGQGIRLFFRGAKGQGLGYLGYYGMYTPSATIDKMIGHVNQGAVSVHLKRGTSGQTLNQLSNPYPSPVDLGTAAYYARQAGQITGYAFYVWNPALGAGGQYMAIPIGTSTPEPFYLPANTSYQVRAAYDGAHLDFQESYKSANRTINLFRAPANAVRFNIYDSNYHLWDMLSLQFNEKASDAEDKLLDAIKPAGLDFNFYSIAADGRRLAVDARPYEGDKVIPLGLNSSFQQDFVIRAESISVPAGGAVTLHDKLLNKYVDMKEGAEYHFTIGKDRATQGNERFELVLKPATATTAKGLEVSMAPNPASDDVQITFTSGSKDNVSVRIMDVSGVSIYSQDLGAKQNGVITVPMSNFAAGVYMVEITQGEQKVTKRLVKE